jgi:glycosyltransferase involved in cell wall biosynthesis
MDGTANIAVVITSHNYGRFLGACLQSVQAQTLRPADVVVVDDGSDDDTEAVVKTFSDVRYFRVDFCNGNRARNYGFSKVLCDFVVFFDADNTMFPQFLEKLYHALGCHTEAAFAYCDRINVADGDVSWYPLPMGHWQAGPFDIARLKVTNYIDLSSMIRANRFPGFDEQLPRYQDWDLWLHMVLKKGYRGVYVPEALFSYRVHNQSLSYREDRDRAVWAIRRKYRIGWGAWPLLRHSFGAYHLALRCWRWLVGP